MHIDHEYYHDLNNELDVKDALALISIWLITIAAVAMLVLLASCGGSGGSVGDGGATMDRQGVESSTAGSIAPQNSLVCEDENGGFLSCDSESCKPIPADQISGVSETKSGLKDVVINGNIVIVGHCGSSTNVNISDSTTVSGSSSSLSQ